MTSALRIPIRPAANHRAWWLAFGLVVAAGAALRFWGLSTHQMWADESCTSYSVYHLLDWPAGGPPRSEVAHWPYLALLRIWTELAGDSAAGLRGFSALAGTLAVLVIGLTGRGMAGRSAGLVAAALAAVHPLHIHYSQEARVYAFWTLIVAAGLYFLWKAAVAGGKWWVAFGAAGWLAVVTHYYTMLWLPATVAAVIVAPHRRQFARSWLLTMGALAIALLPIGMFLMAPNAGTGPRVWLDEVWAGYPWYVAPLKSLWVLLPAADYPYYLGPLAGTGKMVADRLGDGADVVVQLLPVVVLIALGWAALGRKQAKSEEATRVGEEGSGPADGESSSPRTVLLFLWLQVAGFLLLAFAVSVIWRPSYVVGRYDLAAWPAAVLGCGVLITEGCRRWASTGRERVALCGVVTVGLVACSGAIVAGDRLSPASFDAGERAKAIAAAIGKEDLVISLGGYRWFLDHEWRRTGLAAEVVSFPPRHDQQICWDNPLDEWEEREVIAGEAVALSSYIADSLAQGRRVWLLVPGDPSPERWRIDRMLFEELAERGVVVEQRDAAVGLGEFRLGGEGAG